MTWNLTFRKCPAPLLSAQQVQEVWIDLPHKPLWLSGVLLLYGVAAMQWTDDPAQVGSVKSESRDKLRCCVGSPKSIRVPKPSAARELPCHTCVSVLSAETTTVWICVHDQHKPSKLIA